MNLARIRIYPIKALDPLELEEVRISAGGALAGDRRWALFDPQGRFLNGKRCPAIHGLRTHYEAGGARVRVRRQGQPASAARRFSLPDDAPELEAWLAEALGQPVRLGHNEELGFPDDPEAWGPTVVSLASLEAVAAWFPELGDGAETFRRRFRANLEIDGVPPFWEDGLLAAAGTAMPFDIGDVELAGTNPCARCVVPSRDPDAGEALVGFQKRFMAQRASTLPAWAARDRFDHFYRFALNTRIMPSESGKLMRVGDPVSSGHSRRRVL